MLKNPNLSQLNLSEMQMRILRATMNGADASDQELLDETVERAADILNVPENVAEVRLLNFIHQSLAVKNAETESRIQQAFKTGKSSVQHDLSAAGDASTR